MVLEERFHELIDKANNKMQNDEAMRKEVEPLKKSFNIDLGTECYSFKLENAVISDFKNELLPEQDVILTSDVENTTKLLDGELRPMKAYLTNKIRVKGKIQDLMFLKKFF